jgi:hypothetical protein
MTDMPAGSMQGIVRLMRVLAGLTGAVLLFVGVITVFGDNIKAMFGMSAEIVCGETDVKARTKPAAHPVAAAPAASPSR